MKSQQHTDKIRLRFLVVEDQELNKYVSALKKASAGAMHFEFREATHGKTAQEVLEHTLCPFNSLDQRIAWQEDGDFEATAQADANGVRLAGLVAKLQP